MTARLFIPTGYTVTHIRAVLRPYSPYSSTPSSNAYETEWVPLGLNDEVTAGAPVLTSSQARGAAIDGVGVGTVADPVNTATGELVEQHSDLLRPDLRADVSVGRVYNSGDERAGVLGRGWRSSFEFSAVEAADGSVTVSHPSGRQVVYRPDAAGGFVAAAGAAEKLTKVDGALRLSTPNQTVMFDAAGAVATVTAADTGEVLTYTHTDGKVSRIAGPTRHIDLAYRADGRLASATADDGRTVTYGYTDGLLTSVTTPGTKTTTYTYGPAGRLRSARKPGGVLIHETDYDTQGRVIAQRDAHGGVTTFTYEADKNWTGSVTATDASGGVWRDTYVKRVLTKRKTADGVVTKYGYDSDLRLVTQTDAFGTTTLTYDADGRLASTATAEGTVETAYDAAGRISSSTSATGASTTYAYDTAGRLTSTTTAAPNVASAATTYTYDARDLLASVTDAEGAVTRFEYNAAGQVTKTTSPTGVVQTRTYTPEGWLKSVTDPAGTVTYTYNADGQLAKITDPAGRDSTTTYDVAGRVDRAEDHAGRFTAYTYDDAGRVSATTDHAGRAVGYTYDTSGHVKTKTDVKNRTATFGYDDAGRVTQVTDAHGTVSIEYNPAGLRSKMTRPDGSTVIYTYDGRGRLTAAAGGGDAYEYTYDSYGRVLTEKRGASRTLTYAYDALNRITSVRSQDTGPGLDETTTYTYDNVGRVKTVARPGSITDTFAYFADGQLKTVHRGSTLLATYAYDTAARLTTVTLGDGSVERYTYDALSRPLTRRVTDASGANVLDREEITYDTRGNPTRVVRRDATTTYAYDGADQLIRVCATGADPCTTAAATESLTYDATGNRLTRTTSGGTDIYTYNDRDQLTNVQPASGAAVNYTYDGRGRVTQAGALTLSYDAASDQLTNATHTDGRSWTYRYDPRGRRTQSTTTSSSGTTTTFKYAIDPLTGALTTRTRGTTVDRYLPNGIGRADGTSYAYNHADRVGSLSTVTGIVSRKLAVKHAYSYEPFGAVKSTSTKDPATDHGFGDHPDGPGGLVLMNGRAYDPLIGRFLTLDPQGSLYNYANNSPILFSDPSGEIACLGSWGEFSSCMATVTPIADTVAMASGAVATAALGVAAATGATGVLLPVAGVAGTVAGAAGTVAGAATAVGALGRVVTASTTCASGKGSCAGQVAGLALDVALSKVRWARGFNRLGGDDMLPPASAASNIAPQTTSVTRPGPIVASDGTEITGFTGHGIHRVIGDGGARAGVRPEALLDTLRHPLRTTSGVDHLGRPFKIYTGANARIVINPATGRVVSVNPLSGAGAHR